MTGITIILKRTSSPQRSIRGAPRDQDSAKATKIARLISLSVIPVEIVLVETLHCPSTEGRALAR